MISIEQAQKKLKKMKFGFKYQYLIKRIPILLLSIVMTIIVWDWKMFPIAFMFMSVLFFNDRFSFVYTPFDVLIGTEMEREPTLQDVYHFHTDVYLLEPYVKKINYKFILNGNGSSRVISAIAKDKLDDYLTIVKNYNDIFKSNKYNNSTEIVKNSIQIKYLLDLLDILDEDTKFEITNGYYKIKLLETNEQYYYDYLKVLEVNGSDMSEEYMENFISMKVFLTKAEFVDLLLEDNLEFNENLFYMQLDALNKDLSQEELEDEELEENGTLTSIDEFRKKYYDKEV